VSWLANHWKTLATIAVATAVFVAVTAATGGLGAPAALALVAGGFSSGVAGYATGQWLDGKPVTLKGAVVAGGVSAAITLATAGLGRAFAPAISRVVIPAVNKVVPEAVAAAVPQAVKTAAVDASGGAVVGAGVQVGANAVSGKPLTTNLGPAMASGALSGVLQDPATRVLGNPIYGAVTGGRGIAGALLGQAAGTPKDGFIAGEKPPGEPDPETYPWRVKPPAKVGDVIRVKLADLRTRQGAVDFGNGRYSETDRYDPDTQRVTTDGTGELMVPEVSWVDWLPDQEPFWAIREGNHRAYSAALQGKDDVLVRVMFLSQKTAEGSLWGDRDYQPFLNSQVWGHNAYGEEKYMGKVKDFVPDKTAAADGLPPPTTTAKTVAPAPAGKP
jgi:hypothetical protein